MRVSELAKELGVTSKDVMRRLAEDGEFVKSASSTVAPPAALRVREAFSLPDSSRRGTSSARVSSWRTGAVAPPSHPDVVRNIARLKLNAPASRHHLESLAALGSQVVYTAPCKQPGFEDCDVATVRFSGAIETVFGLTREVLFFYSPHRDLQIRTYKAAREALRELPREITPDIMFMYSPDPRARERLDDWSSGNFLAIPLDLPPAADPVALITLLRDYVFSRDLFYETTPVRGERFFGRRLLLQSLRDDILNQRVSGLFGLRKSGKTSVLTQLRETLSNTETIVLVRDLESLPSPPDDPVPDLIDQLVTDLLEELRERRLSTKGLVELERPVSVASFKNALQSNLRRLDTKGVRLVMMLDEIEYLTPSDRIDIHEGNMVAVAQFMGSLRSLVQETENFTFLLSGLTSAIIEDGRLYGRPNPLFSWAKANFVAPFEKHEADELATTVGRKMGITITPDALSALYEASGGHAFLYRHLASTVVSSLPVDVFNRTMERVDVLRVLEAWRLEIAGNMREMLDHVRRYYPEESYLLEVLREDSAVFTELAEDEPQVLGHLLKLGLVQQAGREYELTPVLDLL